MVSMAGVVKGARVTRPVSQRSDMADIMLALSDPVSWIERNVYLRAPVCPETGEVLPAGPIRLTPFTRGALRAALEIEQGRFRWETVVWSMPKKTGKTTIAAAVALWYASAFPGSEIILVANDVQQASNRVYQVIQHSLALHPILAPSVGRSMIRLANGSVIYPHAVDPFGVAGANPGLSVFTELWGFTSDVKRAMWVELTPPATVRFAMRWVESYAGYFGAGSVLEDLYRRCLKSGKFLQVDGVDDGVILVDPDTRLFYLYDHGDPAMRRFAWQTERYYAGQRNLPPTQFDRLHRNEWVSRGSSLLEPEWLRGCLVPDDQIDWGVVGKLPMVLGVDVGIFKATYAIAGISKLNDRWLLRIARVFRPRRGRPVSLTEADSEIVRICSEHSVIELTYDPYQFENTAQRLRAGYIVSAKPFSQHGRGKADSGLIAAIQSKQIIIPSSLYSLVQDQYQTTGWDPARCRLVPLGSDGHNDLLVAMSMALARASSYNLDTASAVSVAAFPV